MEQVRLLKGDNMELLKTLEPNSVDSIVSDAPYGLSFMNKKWDYDVPSVELWKEVLRVLKPGGHVLSFGGTRTYHRMVVNMEDAGFEIRDSISYMYGSGFPKSHNIGKAVDKLNGNEREVVGERIADDITGGNLLTSKPDKIIEITKGNSEWEGWGTALKPSMELICLARKPLSEKSIAENVLKHGTGGINIDDCRVGTETITTDGRGSDWQYKSRNGLPQEVQGTHEGRFPANTILECICYEPHTNPECPCYILDKQSGVSKTTKRTNFKKNNTMWQEKDDDGNTMSGGFDDKGGASRFFYTAKVSKKERNMGLDGFEEKENYQKGNYGSSICKTCGKTDNGTNNHNECGENNFQYKASNIKVKNHHPTVKPINLMTYLCRLITPRDGVVLDMYMGSGSTGISALLEGFNFIGMEMDEDYFNIAEARIKNYEQYRQFKK